MSSTQYARYSGLVSGGSTTGGDLTDVGTDGIVITNGTGAVLGTGTSLAQHVADTTHNGYLSSVDWNTFNSKQAALTIGNLTDVGTDGIVISGGTGAIIGSGTSIAQHVADTTHNGYLSSTDWNTFNGKQAAGNYITALTGDVTASGPGSAAATLATVNSNVGAFTVSSITVNAKGLVTAASTGTTGNLTDVGTDGIVITGGTGAVLGSGASIAQHVADSTHNGYLSQTDWSTFNGKQAAGNYLTALTGDGTASGPGSSALTLATVNSNVGTFASVTVNGKGLVTAASALSGDITTSSAVATLATVNSNVGTFASVTVNGKGLVTAAAALTGDITTSSAVATLATVNSNVGSFTNATITVNAKGLVTAASTGSSGSVTAPPTLQKFTSGSGTYNKDYTFIITSGSATVGATYTNNAVTFTVYATVASATQVVMSGSGAPAASGTLTKASGTGDSTLTFSQVLSPLYLRVRAVGGGAGGLGSGTAAGTVPTVGGNTTWGSTVVVANGGGIGTWNGTPGLGGTASLGTGAIGTAVTGGDGNTANVNGATPLNFTAIGGAGGQTPFGGAARGGGVGTASGGNAQANSGSGGGGGGITNQGNAAAGSGGAAGGFADAILTAPAATYAYAVGGAGSGGGAGTNGNAGGNGAAGYIEVTEYYQ